MYCIKTISNIIRRKLVKKKMIIEQLKRINLTAKLINF